LKELNIFGMREVVGDESKAIHWLTSFDFNMEGLLEGDVWTPGDSLVLV
jgi:hypothetical protein